MGRSLDSPVALAAGSVSRPVLKPGLYPVWRDERTLQLGLDPHRAIVCAPVDVCAVAALRLLDGIRTWPEVLATASEPGAALLRLLAEAGALDDAAKPLLRGVARSTRERLEPDAASLGLLLSGPGAATRVLDRRQRARVLVVGGGRIGAPLASLLTAAGVGTVTVSDRDLVEPADLAPGGLQPADLGKARGPAINDRLASGDDANAGIGPPDIAVLCVPGLRQPDATRCAQLAADDTPYLLATVRQTTGIVGPLVIPGRSCCPVCQELTRTDRDPQWPLLTAQFGTATSRGTTPCDVVLATAVTALATAQLLAFLDGAPAPVTLNASLELALPDWAWRRRIWQPHPTCGCGAASRCE